MGRLENFKSLETHPWYSKLFKKLPVAMQQECERFIRENDALNADQYAQASVRWGIKEPELAKKKQFPYMAEMVLVAGTMEVKNGK